MQCFNHTDTPAVAICLSCGKALCKSCAVSSNDFIVCSQVCKGKLSMKRSLSDKEPTTYLAVSKFIFSVGIVFFLAGCLIIAFEPNMRIIGIFSIVISMVNFLTSNFLKKQYGGCKTGL